MEEEVSLDVGATLVEVAANPIMEVAANPIMEPNETPSTPEKKEALVVYPRIPHGGSKKLSHDSWKHLLNRLKPSNAPKDSNGNPFTHQCTLDGKCFRLPYCQKKNCYVNNKARKHIINHHPDTQLAKSGHNSKKKRKAEQNKTTIHHAFKKANIRGQT